MGDKTAKGLVPGDRHAYWFPLALLGFALLGLLTLMAGDRVGHVGVAGLLAGLGGLVLLVVAELLAALLDSSSCQPLIVACAAVLLAGAIAALVAAGRPTGEAA